MKTSNKILLSFFFFIFGGITLLYIGSKYHKGYYDASNFADQKTLLPPFSVVVAEPGAIFQLKSGKVNKVIQTYRKDAFSNFSVFEVRNDTLFVSPVKQLKAKEGDYRVVPEIFCVNLKSMIAKENSDVRINDFKADTLNININKSNLNWRFEDIGYLSIQAKDSEIYLEGEKLEKLAIKLDKTRINSSIKKRTDVLSGSLINASDLRFSMSNNVNLDADNTSNYDFYGF